MSTMRQTTLLLVDDHALYREGLAGLFEGWEEFQVIGQVGNGLEAVEFCRHTQPSLILMDVQMPVMDGIEATKIIHAEHPDIAIVMLTVAVDGQYLFDAIVNGARGYIMKSTHARRLKDRLRDVANGKGTLSNDAATQLIDIIRGNRLDDYEQRRMDKMNMLLSDHEKQILHYVALGDSNREIGQRLFVSEATVKKQLSAILVKLGLENRVQAAVFAVQAGLLNT